MDSDSGRTSIESEKRSIFIITVELVVKWDSSRVNALISQEPESIFRKHKKIPEKEERSPIPGNLYKRSPRRLNEVNINAAINNIASVDRTTEAPF